MATLRVNGQELEFPGRDSITMDESMVVWAYSKLTLDELEELEGTPAPVLAALIHIAVQRANPEIKAAEIEATVRGLKLAELIRAATLDAEEVVEPDLPLPANRNSDGSGRSALSSGADGKQNSESHPDEGSPANTGMLAPDSLASRLTESVA